VRLLSNFETSREKLIHIILSGQPQLAEKIASPALVQLRQRISMFARLDPFPQEATELYIQHRLQAAGYELEAPLFTREALGLIFQYSEGIPRNINNLCFNSLSLGCALKKKAIDRDVVREVVADLDLDRWQTKSSLAVMPEGSGLRDAPAFLPTFSEPPVSAGGFPRSVLAMAALLLIGGAVFASRWVGPKASVHVNSQTAQHPAAAAPASNQSHAPVVPAETATQADAVTPPPPGAPGPSSNQASPSMTSVESATKTDSAVSPPTPVATLSTGASPSLQASPAGTTIRVAQGRTLLGICVKSFGSCNPQLLQAIHRLNPRLSNLDHIETGQTIRLPVSKAVMEKPGKTSSGERNTP
jgi:LysM repeat protein